MRVVLALLLLASSLALAQEAPVRPESLCDGVRPALFWNPRRKAVELDNIQLHKTPVGTWLIGCATNNLFFSLDGIRVEHSEIVVEGGTEHATQRTHYVYPNIPVTLSRGITSSTGRFGAKSSTPFMAVLPVDVRASRHVVRVNEYGFRSEQVDEHTLVTQPSAPPRETYCGDVNSAESDHPLTLSHVTLFQDTLLNTLLNQSLVVACLSNLGDEIVNPREVQGLYTYESSSMPGEVEYASGPWSTYPEYGTDGRLDPGETDFVYMLTWRHHRGELIDIQLAVRGEPPYHLPVGIGPTHPLRAIDSTSHRPTNLSRHEADDTVPAWSPDGRHIAFVKEEVAANGEADFEIYVMDADGSNPTKLTDHDEWDVDPTWSPDGGRIAFASYREGFGEIYVMRLDGSNVVRLTHNDVQDKDPTWSPDGSKIAFMSNRNGNWDIYVMDAEGGEEQRLTTSRRMDSSPSWSPDGSKIAFYRVGRGDNLDIYVMNADGSRQTRLTRNRAMDYYPAWSPDGGKIAFTSDRDEFAEIYLIDLDSRDVWPLTHSFRFEEHLTWSPDGSRIAFHSLQGDNWEISVLELSGNH